MAKKNDSDVCAAITQHSSGLRYLELKGKAGAFKVVKQAVIPLTRAGSADSVASVLMKEVGSFSEPVVFGLPMRDCMTRVIEFPRMPIEEAKLALQFDFDRHFTWPYSECSVDACEVSSPLTPSKDKMSMLVAVSRNEHISRIVQISEKAGIELKAIEPMNVAVLRAVIGHQKNRSEEAWYSVYSDADGLHFAFVDNENGLIYRSSPAGINGIIDAGNEEDVQRAMSEIQRTISFVSNQFKGVQTELLVLSGAIAGNSDIVKEIENSVGLKVKNVNVYEQCGIKSGELAIGFEPALGLCMRSL